MIVLLDCCYLLLWLLRFILVLLVVLIAFGLVVDGLVGCGDCCLVVS